MSSGKKNKTKYIRKTPREIFLIARIMLRLSKSTSNIILFFEELKQVFPKLRFKVVDDSLMPNEEARAYPKSWLIWIRKSIYEGLIRGRVRGRWTLAHELGHILLQHPGARLQRSDTAKYSRNGRIYEYEANLFAAGILAPFDKVEQCRSATEIKSLTRISLEAAQFRIQELKIEAIRKREAIKAGLPESAYAAETAHPDNLEEQVVTVCRAIGATIANESSTRGDLFEPIKNNTLASAILVVAGAQLLLKAHASFRNLTELNQLWRASALVEAILLIQPIRGIGTNSSSESIRLECNRSCALRIAATVLDISPDKLRAMRLPYPNPWGAHTFESSYLKSFVTNGIASIEDSATVLSLGRLSDEKPYRERNFLCSGDVHDLEFLFDTLTVLNGLARDGKLNSG
jgi:Zn-dependent peptidase ImmA (M78 family)